MVNLILTGAAGRMGQAILSVLPGFRNLQLAGAVGAIGHPNIGKSIYKGVKLTGDLSSIIKDGDVVIDFTGAESSVTNLKIAASAKKPVVIGSTGHDSNQRAELVSLSKKIPIVCSPNMSVGVNTMWKLIEMTTLALGKNYQIDIVETHHIHKKDAPSGTAKKMLEIVAEAGGHSSVKSIREGEVVGDHTIIFTSPYERLEITHRAFSREVFAVGALRAAEWVIGKPAGLYDIGDVLNISA